MQIVLVGNFNPAIFHPRWFASEGILSEPEAEAATLNVVHPQFTAFTTDRFSIQVQLERFTADAADPKNQEPLRDLVLGAFRALHHTPIRFLGINLNSHFQLRDRAELDAIGRKLVPEKPWSDIGLDAAMLGLAMQAKRPDDGPGYVQVRVQPSAQVRNGVFVQVNDHYDFSAGDARDGAEEASGILEDGWGDSVKYSRRITRELLR